MIGGTIGQQNSAAKLISELAHLEVDHAVVAVDVTRLLWLQFAHPFLDLTQAYLISRAVRARLREIEPRAVIYPSSLSTIFEPAQRLSKSAVRFDAVAAENRRGVRNLILRLMERRSLASIALLLPYSVQSDERRRPLPRVLKQCLPTAVDPSPGVIPRRKIFVCYAGNPEKKGLDLVIAAWLSASLGNGWQLHVTGIDAAAGQSWLARRGLKEPPGLVWRGRLTQEAHRRLGSGAEVVVAASRYEDFGLTQLEALADGAILATVPSAGPYEALKIARRLDPFTVASTITAPDLARVLKYVALMSAEVKMHYRTAAAEVLAPYTSDEFRRNLSENILPVILPS